MSKTHIKYCDDCKNLDPKECEQTPKKEPHMCRYWNVRMFHFDKHPHIECPEDCVGYEKEECRI